MHRLNTSGSRSRGFYVNDPAIDIQHINESLDPHTADLAFNPEFHGYRFYSRCDFVEVLHDERFAGPGKLCRVLVVAKLDLVTFQSPCFAEEGKHARNGQVLVSFDLLGKVLSEGGVHGPPQNQIPIGWVRVSEDILEPPSRVAVHKGTNLRG